MAPPAAARDIVSVAECGTSRLLPHPPNFTPIAAIALLDDHVAWGGEREAYRLLPTVQAPERRPPL